MVFSDIFVTGSNGKRVLDNTGCPILKDYPSGAVAVCPTFIGDHFLQITDFQLFVKI